MSELKSFSLASLKETKQSTSFVQKYKELTETKCSLTGFLVPESKFGLQAAIQDGDQLFYFSKKNDSVPDFDASDELEITMFEAICDITNDDGVIVLKQGEKKYFITDVIE